METPIIASLISGFFAVVTALGSVYLKHYLEQSRAASPAAPAAVPSASSATPVRVTRQQSETSQGPFSMFRPILVLAIAFVVGAVYRKFKTYGLQETIAVVSLYVFIAASFIGLVLLHRRSARGIWPYQLDCLALWAAFASGFSLVQRHIWGDLIMSTTMFWLGFAIVGGLIVWFTRPAVARQS